MKIILFFLLDEIKHYVSSSRGNSKVQTLKVLKDIVTDLVKHEDSWPFLKPVNKKLVSRPLQRVFCFTSKVACIM